MSRTGNKRNTMARKGPSTGGSRRESLLTAELPPALVRLLGKFVSTDDGGMYKLTSFSVLVTETSVQRIFRASPAVFSANGYTPMVLAGSDEAVLSALTRFKLVKDTNPNPSVRSLDGKEVSAASDYAATETTKVLTNAQMVEAVDIPGLGRLVASRGDVAKAYLSKDAPRLLEAADGSDPYVRVRDLNQFRHTVKEKLKQVNRLTSSCVAHRPPLLEDLRRRGVDIMSPYGTEVDVDFRVGDVTVTVTCVIVHRKSTTKVQAHAKGTKSFPGPAGILDVEPGDEEASGHLV